MSDRLHPHFTAGWWVLTHHGWLPYLRVAGLSPLAVELYGLLLRVAEPAEAVTAHASPEHAGLIVQDWSLAELGRHLGGRTAACILGARRELEDRGLVLVLGAAGGGQRNVYAVVSGRQAVAS